MSSQKMTAEQATVTVENVGGIDRTAVGLTTGVNVLTGRNATNRTSFLRALMGGLGSDDVSLKADADEGSIELELEDATYTRELERAGDNVITRGDPYLDDPTLADLFAFLLESNEARQAVVRDDDLREILMRPVDTTAIRREIDQLQDRRSEIDRRLDELDELERRLPTLEQRKQSIEDDIAETRAELEEKREEVEEADANVEAAADSDVEEKLERLRERRSDLEEIRFRIESERESREALEDERDEIEERLNDVEELSGERLDEIGAELDRLREEKRSVGSLVNQLQSVISFNQETLSDGEAVAGLLDGEEDGGAVTDELVSDGTVTCWTCGSEVERDAIEETVGRLEDIRKAQMDRRRTLDERIEELEEKRSAHESTRDERERLESERERIAAELDEREATIEELLAKRDDVREEVEELEETVAEMENDAYDELLALHRETYELEFELESLEDDRDEVEQRIAEVEDELEERDELRTERGEITESLSDLRTRIERLETEAVESFNEHMENVLDILEYGNLARVWIERTEREVREGRRTVTRSTFDLHIVRESEDGVAYEDTVAHLSESEREVVGLIFALAGYLVHDVHEEVPFMLLDSLEAIDSDRIAHLVEYLEDYPDYLVVALLPEDAAALDDGYRRVTEI